MSLESARYIVGIDLGTTHTVLAYTDTQQPASGIQLFEVEQLTAPGELKAQVLFPSIRYHPAKGELSEAQIKLPWAPSSESESTSSVVFGALAKDLSARVEGRSVLSAKSWLSHDGVDRSADILPWGAANDVDKVSPIEASASYLAYLRDAWLHQFPDEPLAQQEIILTVPASFDETARALTVKAAKQAGLAQVRLLEEPQAVCYDWLQRHEQDLAEKLAHSKLMLVCDVGGGTTDLTLIKIEQQQGSAPKLTRIGVGNHLMLGGDNIDLALAYIAEKRLVSKGEKLSTAALAQLLQQCRTAKERLLTDDHLKKASVTVLGAGSRLIGGSKSTEFSADEVKELALNGFFPEVAISATPKVKRSALVEFGLPYVADAAVTRHVAAFLSHYQRASAEALGCSESEVAIPDALLLNGGIFNSDLLTQRITQQLEQWRGAPVQLLENNHPDLAVAYGAVASGLAQRGQQTRIGGGSARSYFLVVDEEKQQGLCILPRATEENQQIRLESHHFLLKVGAPVEFNISSSTLDKRFEPGQLVNLDAENFPMLPPVATVMKKRGKMKGSEVEVQLAAMLTEVGTLQVQNISTEDNNRRWALEFDLRSKQTVDQLAGSHPNIETARKLIDASYGSRSTGVEPRHVKKIRVEMEKLLGSRDNWEPPLLRDLFTTLLTGMKKRRRTQDHERLWYNLAGFTLRPGFGYAVDDWRIEQIKPLYQQGVQYKKEANVWAEWWSFWRRVSGGLSSTDQEMIFDDIAPYLQPLPEKPKAHLENLKRKAYLAFDDMLRLAANLENISLERKVELGEWLLKRLEKPTESSQCWWALGRLGARVPLYGSAHNVVPVVVVEQWIEKILQLDWNKVTQGPLAVTTLSRRSGDRDRDINDALRTDVIARLKSHRVSQTWVAMLENVVELNAVDEKKIWGDALPPGLTLIKA